MEKRTIVLATYGKTREHLHGDCMEALRYQLGMLVMDTRANMHIDVARSLLACSALAHGADVVVFIDHDILFDPMDVEPLAEEARKCRGIVGAAYAQRRMGAGIVGGIDPSVEEVVFGEGGKLYPAVGVIGMGFTAIHRAAFELLDALPEYAEVNSSDGTMRPYFRTLIVNGYWLHEDASFCHAVRTAGGATLVDTRIRLKHLGDHPFDVQDAKARPPEEPTVRVRIKPVR